MKWKNNESVDYPAEIKNDLFVFVPEQTDNERCNC